MPEGGSVLDELKREYLGFEGEKDRKLHLYILLNYDYNNLKSVNMEAHLCL